VHTLTGYARSIDAGTNHHDIVDYAEATFAGNPVTSFVYQATIGENGSFIHMNSTAVKTACERHFIWMEEFPT